MREDVVRSNSRGDYRVAHIGDDVVWFKFDGWIMGEWWKAAEPLFDAVTKERGSLLMLADGGTWTGYEPEFRKAATNWFVRHRKTLRGVHLFAKSRLLKMGVEVVNLVVPVVKVYDTAPEFMRVSRELASQLDSRVKRAGFDLPA